MAFVKRNVVAIVLGTAVVVAGAYVGAHALTPTQKIELEAAGPSAQAQQQGEAPTDGDGPPAEGPRPRGGPPHHGPGFIRGEGVVEHNGEFPTVRINQGVLESVDGSTLVIKEADGTTVRVETGEDTRIRRDRDRATLGDLKSGDHVRTLEEKEGDAYTTKFVHAISPEEWQEHQDRRDQRRERREERRERRGAP